MNQQSQNNPWAWIIACAAGGLLFLRLWHGAAVEDQARRVERLRAAAGVQSVETPLKLPSIDLPLQLHPSSEQQETVALIGAELSRSPVVVLHFWATWCPPCLKELPSLQRLGLRLKRYGVRVVAVSYDDTWEPQLTLFKRLFGVSTPAGVLWARDPQGQAGKVEAMMRTRLGTEKLPETWILSGDVVVGRLVGAQDWSKDSVARYLVALSEVRRD